ncbi:MAG: hypothetical protein KDD33_05125 [Bdellovibrionales bacterium]|nr:hypothetical protein [Bdellovibrionales bacterium]
MDLNDIKNNSVKSDDTIKKENGPRSVGLLLGIGIFFLPYLFSWFTLRKGHTTKAKVLSFGWLALLLAANIYAPNDGQNIQVQQQEDIQVEEPQSADENAQTEAQAPELKAKRNIASAPKAQPIRPQKIGLGVKTSKIMSVYSQPAIGMAFTNSPANTGEKRYVASKDGVMIELVDVDTHIKNATMIGFIDQQTSLNVAVHVLGFAKQFDDSSVDWVSSVVKVAAERRVEMKKNKRFGNKNYKLSFDPNFGGMGFAAITLAVEPI